MDNASKALIIAGGIFLAILIISVGLYFFMNAKELSNTMNENNEISAIESFNRYYLSFDSSIMGIDVVNIANRVDNDIANGHVITKNYKQSLIDNLSSKIDNKDTNPEDLTTNDYSYSVGYDSDGYINSVTISMK